MTDLRNEAGAGLRDRGVTPLTQAERERLTHALADVRSAVGAVFEWVPTPTRRATDIARHLGMDRATVHRLLDMARSRGDGLEVISRAPGAEGMRTLIDAARSEGAPRKLLDRLEGAIDAFDLAIRESAGSKRALERRVRATMPVSDAESVAEAEVRDDRARREMLVAAAGALGKRVELRADVSLFRMSRERAGWLDCVQARGVFGFRARDGAQPMAIDYRNRAPGVDADGSERGAGGESSPLLERFCTMPAPLVVSRGAGGRVRHVIDPARTREGGSVDVAVAHRVPASARHPADEPDDRRLEVGALIRDPTGALVHDVYLEPEVLRGCTPTAELYIWSPGLEHSLVDHWLDRVERTPAVEVLGPGLARAQTALHERHVEFSREVFDRVGWEPEKFVGFRLTARPPLWGGAYFLIFDFERSRTG